MLIEVEFWLRESEEKAIAFSFMMAAVVVFHVEIVQTQIDGGTSETVHVEALGNTDEVKCE